MLRECVKFEALAKILMYSKQFYDFFDYIEFAMFDIASIAFSTFKDLLTLHKKLTANFLGQLFDEFFEKFNKLLSSQNYVTKTQSLKLLSELIVDRHNFDNVMKKYFQNPKNLKIFMNLLRENSENVQFEAFHVFKLFVANPERAKGVNDILLRNRDKLVNFLTNFLEERTEDEQLQKEKAFLIKEIKNLK